MERRSAYERTWPAPSKMPVKARVPLGGFERGDRVSRDMVRPMSSQPLSRRSRVMGSSVEVALPSGLGHLHALLIDVDDDQAGGVVP